MIFLVDCCFHLELIIEVEKSDKFGKIGENHRGSKFIQHVNAPLVLNHQYAVYIMITTYYCCVLSFSIFVFHLVLIIVLVLYHQFAATQMRWCMIKGGYGMFCCIFFYIQCQERSLLSHDGPMTYCSARCA